MMKIKLKESSGITLVSLVVTIIVLIILATISVGVLTGDNGIISQAKDSKEKAEISEEQEAVNISVVQACGENKYGELTETNLNKALDKNIGEGKYILNIDSNSFRVTYKDSKRTYLIDEEANVSFDDTPIISDKYPGDVTDGGKWDGSVEKPYKIASVEDYVVFIQLTRDEEYQQASFTLEEDLDFLSANSYVNPENQDFGDYNRDGKTEGLLKEICNTSGRGLSNGFYLYGTLDGKGHTLKNFYMKDFLGDNGDEESDFLIGVMQMNYGTIKNLNIKGKMVVSSISTSSYSVHVGAIVGVNEAGGQIINCDVDVDVIVEEVDIELEDIFELKIGGIAGYNVGEINNCEYKGNINSKLIVNSNMDATYTTDILIGGIAGYNDNKIINSINKGNINSYYEFYTTVGTENEQISTGGITGKNNDEAILENCINIGNVQSESPTSEIRVAGISSESEDLATCIISNVFNSGKIIAISNEKIRVGGILAEGYGKLSYAYNIGEIATDGTPSSSKIGAIIGDYHTSTTSSSIENCYFNKISGLYGEEDGDHEDIIVGLITAVENLTEEKVIQYLNENVDTNNASSERIWEKIKYVNGQVTI